MFISKFHALLGNKFIWGGFAFIVAIAFVFWGAQTGGSGQSAEANKAGMLDGKEISREEFRNAYFNSYLSTVLMLGRPPKITEEVNRALKDMAWKWLASLKMAHTLALPVTDDEVVSAIREQPYFQVEGQFSQEQYQAFVNRFLLNLRVSEIQFEDHIRQEILLSKLRYLISQALWISPLELEQVFHQLYDKFVLSFTSLLAEELGYMVTISDEEANEFFEKHTEEFILPEQVSVCYATFPVKNFVDDKAVDAEDVRNYYDEHIDEFSTIGTNDWDEVQPFDKVKDEIRSKLTLEKATLLASDKASEFEVMLAPDRDGNAPSFEKAAESFGLGVSTSACFSIDGVVEGIDADAEFREAAFDLRQTPDDYFSYPVRGKDSFYVLALHKRVPPRLPEFNEVKSSVIIKAREEAVFSFLEGLASDIHESVSAALSNGKSFSEAVESFGLELFTTEPITVTSGLSDYVDSDFFYVLMKEALSHNAKELIDVIPVENGFIIAYVNSRISGDRATYEAIKNDLQRYIKRHRENILFDEWQTCLLKSEHFEDFMVEKESLTKESDAAEQDEQDED